MRQGKSANGLYQLDRSDRKRNQGYVDIEKLTIEQLNELIVRQNKLLTNRYFLEKLPDNGKRIIFFKNELEKVKKKKQEECDEACQLISSLNLNNKNAEELEWNQGKLNTYKKQLDSDDDDDGNVEEEEEDKERRKQEVDPLKLVATHSGTADGKNNKISFSKNKELKDVKKLLYVDKFCKKYEESNNFKERFKPNQFKNNDKTLFKSSAEQVKKRLGNKWEVTEATPPIPIYKNVMMISLSESLKLQREQAEKLKEIEHKHATEKLLQNMFLKIDNKLPINNKTEYRNTRNHFEESSEDDEGEISDSYCED